MLRDGVCDEVTNIQRCLYDGGDCCIAKPNKDRTMCKDCSCILDFDREWYSERSKQTGVVTYIKDPDIFDKIVWRIVKEVEDVVMDEVCIMLCLDNELDSEVNGWKYSYRSLTCTCAWLEPIKDCDYLSYLSGVNGSSASVASVASVQRNKILRCGKYL